MQVDKQSPLMQIAPRMLATEQKPRLGELESNVLFLHSNSGDPDNSAETAQVGFLLPFWQGPPTPRFVKFGDFAWDLHKFSL